MYTFYSHNTVTVAETHFKTLQNLEISTLIHNCPLTRHLSAVACGVGIPVLRGFLVRRKYKYQLRDRNKAATTIQTGKGVIMTGKRII